MVKIPTQHQPGVFGPGNVGDAGREQHLPATGGLAHVEPLVPRGLRVVRSGFKGGHGHAVSRRSEAHVAGPQFTDAKQLSSVRFAPPQLRALPSASTSRGSELTPLPAQKILERVVDGVLVAAIDEPIVPAAVGIHIDRVPAAERQHGQIRFRAGRCPVPAITRAEEQQQSQAQDFLPAVWNQPLHADRINP